MAHKHSVYDTDAHFSINPFTRAIKNESTSKVAVIQHDHNSERFTFEIPRRVDGHDMSVCDRVEVHYINMDSTNPENISADIYEVDDLQVSPDDSGFVVCSWLLSQNATKYAGSLNFLVRFICLDEGKVAYAWHTAVFTGISVSNGILNNAEEIIEPYVDVLAQWKADLFGVGDTEEQRLLTVSAEQQAAIAAKGQAVLDSIPDEYEALQAQADENTRIKAGAIVLDAKGESIVVNDASDFPMMGLKLFGKSTQDGTPTPDAPVDVVSVENPVVSVYGKNLLENTIETKTHLGCDIVVNNDGSVVINGTATSEGTIVFNNHLVLPLGTYKLSGERTVAFLRDQNNKHKQTFFTGATITIENATDNLCVGVYANKGQTFNNLKTYPMLRLSTETDDSFELYKEKQTVETSHTLHGIPVSSGGNYTDANGQQWICDEVDLKRGVYVQRTMIANYDGSDDERWVKSAESYFYLVKTSMTYTPKANGAALATRFVFVSGSLTQPGYFKIGNAYGPMIRVPGGISDVDSLREWITANPFSVIYELETPIETPLSEAEINAFKALHSNKPNTTILNDSGAFMAVSYVADTKTYIDNKIKELMEGVTE